MGRRLTALPEIVQPKYERAQRSARRAGGRLGVRLAVGAVALFFVWELYCAAAYVQMRRTAPSFDVGNFRRNLQQAASGDPTREVRFAVLGDWHTHGGLPETMERLAEQKPDFIVFLGDMVRDNRPEFHQFLQSEFSNVSLPCPALWAVGNHDIGKRYPLERWEKTYGPSQCYFERSGNLFIIARLWGSPDHAADGREFLRRTLAEHAASARRIFVFNHIPPKLGFGLKFDGMAGQEEVLRLMDEYEVDYFISGHYHGYARAQRGKTTYLASGGGGGRLRGDHLGFHHAVTFTVRQDAVQERICALPSHFSLERIHARVITGVIHWTTVHPWKGMAVNVAALALALGTITFRGTRRPNARKARSASREEDTPQLLIRFTKEQATGSPGTQE